MSALPVDPPVRYYAELAAQVYTDAPDFGAVQSAARARLYAGGRVLVFRGSDNFETWLHDFQALPTRSGNLGLLHSGIYDAWEEVASQILALKAPPDIIVGHSEGAGLAQICTGAFVRAGHKPTALYAFEPPRIAGDATLRGYIESSGTMAFCTRHGLDPVPDVPTWLDQALDLASIGVVLPGKDPIWYHLMENIIPVFPG